MKSIKASLILSLGLVMSSIVVSFTFWHVRLAAHQYINVKGLAEREVDATVGIWTIEFEASANDVNQANTLIKQQSKVLVAFLKEQGFADEDISYGSAALQDLWKYEHKPETLRYRLGMKLTVCASNVKLMWESAQKNQELLKKGVQLVGDRWQNPVEFIFTDLNKIKPEMLREATMNARKAAKQLASDANIQLGSLRSATQGAFSIANTHIPIKKKVRVVINVNYAIR